MARNTYYTVHKGPTHIFKEHIEVIDEKNKTKFLRDKVVKISCAVLVGEGIRSVSNYCGIIS